MKRLPHRNKIWVMGIILLALSCTSLTDLAKRGGIRKPVFRLTGSRITGLSFQGIDLTFDVRVENPNSLGITLAGFQYDFQVNQKQLLSGNRTEQVRIPAGGEEELHIPVSLLFKQVYQLYGSLRDRDSMDYQIDVRFLVNLPVLGQITVPLKKSGKLPAVKIPELSLRGVQLKKLTFTGADLEVWLELDNPNAFSFQLNRLKYKLNVNRLEWLQGMKTESASLPGKGKQIIRLPLHLDLLKLGSTVYRMLQDNQPLDYELSGKAELGFSLPVMKKATLPFDKKGKIKISR